MAFDKVVDSAKLNAAMTATADAIRGKTGGTDPVPWDEETGYKTAVEGIEAGGGGQKTYFCKHSGAMYYPVMNIPDVIQGFAGPVFKDAVYLEELYAPNAQLDEPNEMGQECFSGCKALRIVYLPKATYYMHYNFRYCTGLNEVQFGSIGYPVTNIAVYTFNGVTQSGLTITVYVDAATLADIPTAVKNNAPWGATNATVIYRNSTTGEVITE